MKCIRTFSGAWLHPVLPQVTHIAFTASLQAEQPREGFSILLVAVKRRMFPCIFQKFSHEQMMCCALLCPATGQVYPAIHKPTVLPPGFPGSLGLPTLLEPPERPRGKYTCLHRSQALQGVRNPG